MNVRASVAVLSPAALAVAIGCSAPAIEGVSTSIRPQDCAAPPDKIAAPFTAKDLGVQQCPSPPGLRLLVVASDANSWLELRTPTYAWSAEQVMVYESPIGLFPSVGGDATSVEWRRRPGEDPTALIFRVTAQDRDNPAAHRTAWFVTRIQPDRACLLGRAATVEEARALADSSRQCSATPAPA